MTEWRNTPAIGVVLAKLAELHVRALRLDAARKVERTLRFATLLAKGPR